MSYLNHETGGRYCAYAPVLGNYEAPHRYVVQHLVPGLRWVETTVYARNRVHAMVIAHQAGCAISTCELVR